MNNTIFGFGNTPHSFGKTFNQAWIFIDEIASYSEVTTEHY
jgi:hypothetical protein